MGWGEYVYIVAPIVAWVFAQLLKMFLAPSSGRSGHRLTWQNITASGGMPSSHAAGAVALLTSLGINEGISSPVFGLGFLVTVLVCYDSLGVRRVAGENTSAIRVIANKLRLSTARPHVQFKGHTPTEVLVGVVFGFFIGFVLSKIL